MRHACDCSNKQYCYNTSLFTSIFTPCAHAHSRVKVAVNPKTTNFYTGIARAIFFFYFLFLVSSERALTTHIKSSLNCHLQNSRWLHGDGCRLISSVYTSYVGGGMLFTQQLLWSRYSLPDSIPYTFKNSFFIII